MKPLRPNSIYVSDKVLFYAHVLAKAKCNGTQADMTIDNLIDCELTDKWEREFPQLVDAYEQNCRLRLDNKKRFAEHESETIRALSPVPGAQKTPVVSREKEAVSPTK